MNEIRRFSLFCLAAAAMALAGCSPDIQESVNIQNNLSEADHQAMIGRTTEARVWADRAIKVNPKKQRTYTDFLNTADDDPGLSIAKIFLKTGDDATLIAYMRDATRKFPGDIEAWAALVDAEGRLGQTAQKQQDAKALAARIESKLTKPGVKIDGTLLASLGQAYFDAGDEVNGEKNYRKAIAIYSTDPIPPNGLAYHFAVTNNKAHLAEALSLANQSLRLARSQSVSDEGLAGIQDTLGWVQYRLGDSKGAFMNLTDAAAAAPRQAEIRYHLGMVFLAQGDAFAARTEMRHALLLNPDYADAAAEANRLQNAPEPKTSNGDEDV